MGHAGDLSWHAAPWAGHSRRLLLFLLVAIRVQILPVLQRAVITVAVVTS